MLGLRSIGCLAAIFLFVMGGNLEWGYAQDIPPQPEPIIITDPPIELPPITPVFPSDSETDKLVSLSKQLLRLEVRKTSEPSKVLTRCTAFLLRLKEGVFLTTARHCLQGKQGLKVYAAELSVIRPDRRLHVAASGKLKAYSSDEFVHSPLHDAAAVKVDPRDYPFTDVLSLSDSSPEIGDATLASGFPGGKGPYAYECTVLGHKMGLLNKHQMTLAPVMNCPSAVNLEGIQGASGGPVLNSDNAVVGLIAGIELEKFEVELSTGNRLEALAFNGLTYFTALHSLEISESALRLPVREDGSYVLDYLDPRSGEMFMVRGYLSQEVLVDEYQMLSARGKVVQSFLLNEGRLVATDSPARP